MPTQSVSTRSAIHPFIRLLISVPTFTLYRYKEEIVLNYLNVIIINIYYHQVIKSGVVSIAALPIQSKTSLSALCIHFATQHCYSCVHMSALYLCCMSPRLCLLSR